MSYKCHRLRFRIERFCFTPKYKKYDGDGTLTINSYKFLKYYPVWRKNITWKLKEEVMSPYFATYSPQKHYSHKARIFKNLSIMFCNLDVNKFKGSSIWIRMTSYSASRGWLIVRIDCWVNGILMHINHK